MSKFSHFQRAVAICTLLFFSLESATAYALPTLAAVPKQAGRVQVESSDQTGKHAILVLNAHTSSDAQKNISALLKHFQSQGISLVGLEGSGDFVDGSLFRDFPYPEAFQTAAWEMVKEGIFTGAEYFYLTEDALPTFYGLEDEDTYFENGEAFRATYAARGELKETLTALGGAFLALKNRIYSKQLRKLDGVVSQHREENLAFVDYASGLIEIAKRSGIQLTEFESVYALSKAMSREKKISQRGLNKDLAVIASEARQSNVEEIRGLLRRASSPPRDDGVSDYQQIHTRLSQLIKSEQIDLTKFKNLKKFVTWLEAFVAVDSKLLFTELEAVREALYARLAKSEKEKQLVEISHQYDLLKKLLSIELTQDEWARLSLRERPLLSLRSPGNQMNGLKQSAEITSTSFDSLSRNDISGLIASAQRLGLFGPRNDVDVELLSKAEAHAVRFYELAELRNEIFSEKIVAAMEREEQDTTVVVIGGFHEAGLKAALQAKGVGTSVVSPKIEKKMADIPYVERILGTPSALESPVQISLSMFGQPTSVLGLSSSEQRARDLRTYARLAARRTTVKKAHETIETILRQRLSQLPLVASVAGDSSLLLQDSTGVIASSSLRTTPGLPAGRKHFGRMSLRDSGSNEVEAIPGLLRTLRSLAMTKSAGPHSGNKHINLFTWDYFASSLQPTAQAAVVGFWELQNQAGNFLGDMFRMSDPRAGVRDDPMAIHELLAHVFDPGDNLSVRNFLQIGAGPEIGKLQDVASSFENLTRGLSEKLHSGIYDYDAKFGARNKESHIIDFQYATVLLKPFADVQYVFEVKYSMTETGPYELFFEFRRQTKGYDVWQKDERQSFLFDERGAIFAQKIYIPQKGTGTAKTRLVFQLKNGSYSSKIDLQGRAQAALNVTLANSKFTDSDQLITAVVEGALVRLISRGSLPGSVVRIAALADLNRYPTIAEKITTNILNRKYDGVHALEEVGKLEFGHRKAMLIKLAQENARAEVRVSQVIRWDDIRDVALRPHDLVQAVKHGNILKLTPGAARYDEQRPQSFVLDVGSDHVFRFRYVFNDTPLDFQMWIGTPIGEGFDGSFYMSQITGQGVFLSLTSGRPSNRRAVDEMRVTIHDDIILGFQFDGPLHLKIYAKKEFVELLSNKDIKTTFKVVLPNKKNMTFEFIAVHDARAEVRQLNDPVDRAISHAESNGIQLKFFKSEQPGNRTLFSYVATGKFAPIQLIQLSRDFEAGLPKTVRRRSQDVESGKKRIVYEDIAGDFANRLERYFIARDLISEPTKLAATIEELEYLDRTGDTTTFYYTGPIEIAGTQAEFHLEKQARQITVSITFDDRTLSGTFVQPNDVNKVNQALAAIAQRLKPASGTWWVFDSHILGWSQGDQSLASVLDKLIKEYDVRGFDGLGDPVKYPKQMDPQLLTWFGRALGSAEFTSEVHGQTVALKPGDTFVIAGDNGPSTEMLRENLIKGLTETGVNVIDLGITVSGHLYKNISTFGAQGGLYVTRSHVEVGTNGMKPNVGGITLYGDMLKALGTQIKSGRYRKSEPPGEVLTRDSSTGTDNRTLASKAYRDSLREEFSGLKDLLARSGLKVAVNLNGGSATGYADIVTEVIGSENIETLLKTESDAWSRKGLADPSRLDDVALSHPQADIVAYSEANPTVPVFNFDLDSDRVSILWSGRLYLGDEMFYPIIEYLLTLDSYRNLNDTFYFDSRMKSEFAELVEHFGGVAKLHPKGHSKVKATMDLMLRGLAKRNRYESVQAFLDGHPGFKLVQAEYSLHMFLTNQRGESFDDALQFFFFWLQAFSELKESRKQLDWTLADYIQNLKDESIIHASIQLKEQRTPMPEDAKKPVMIEMKDQIVRQFGSNPDFQYIESWRDFEGRTKPYTLVNNDGVFHFFTPDGDFFWGWSNTSPKVAIGAQSASEKNREKLAGVVTALMIHSRDIVARQTSTALPQINPQETKPLFNLFGVNIESGAEKEASAQLEAKIREQHPDFDSVFTAIAPRAEVRLSPANYMTDISKLIALLQIKDSQVPRVINTASTAIAPSTLIHRFREQSDLPEDEVANRLAEIDFFKPHVARYRVDEEKEKGFSPAAAPGLGADVRISGGGTQPYRLNFVGDHSKPDDSITTLLELKAERVANVPFAFRDEMDAFLKRFLTDSNGASEYEFADLLDRVNQVLEFFEGIELADIKYVVTSGIGANEMYSHQLKEVLNAYFKSIGTEVEWIVVNNPDHIDRRLPVDATHDNTVVFEMSRSGGTKETVDFADATKDRFRKRIVAANEGTLNENAQAFQREAQAGDKILIIDDIPSHIGGRQMNRKTLMTFVPLFMALLAGTKDVDEAKRLLRVYVKASLEANDFLNYDPAEFGYATDLAELLYTYRTAGGRFKFSLISDTTLAGSANELLQLHNEGANKNIAGGKNLNILDGFDLSQQSLAAFRTVVKNAGDEQMPIVLLNENSDDYTEGQRLVEELRSQGIPVIPIRVRLEEDDVEHNLRTLAQLTNLLQDVVVYFTYLTDQDANSNPAVKGVRERTPPSFEVVSEGKEAGAANTRIGLEAVGEKLEAARAKEEAKAKQKLAERLSNLDVPAPDARYAPFQEALEQIAEKLPNVTPEQATEIVLGATDRNVLTFDVGEAAGSSVKTPLLVQAIDETEMSDMMGSAVESRSVRSLPQQVTIQENDVLKISVVLEAKAPSNFDAGQLPAEQLAQYWYSMHQDGRAEDFKYFPLVHMEVDEDDPLIHDLHQFILETFSDLGVTSPLIRLPKNAHSGIEAPMSFPQHVFVIALLSTNAAGEAGGGNEIVEGNITVDDATNVYGSANVAQMSVGGSPTALFEMENSEQLAAVTDTIKDALRRFRNKIQRAEVRGRLTIEEAVEQVGEVLATPKKNYVEQLHAHAVASKPATIAWNDYKAKTLNRDSAADLARDIFNLAIELQRKIPRQKRSAGHGSWIMRQVVSPLKRIALALDYKEMVVFTDAFPDPSPPNQDQFHQKARLEVPDPGRNTIEDVLGFHSDELASAGVKEPLTVKEVNGVFSSNGAKLNLETPVDLTQIVHSPDIVVAFSKVVPAPRSEVRHGFVKTPLNEDLILGIIVSDAVERLDIGRDALIAFAVRDLTPRISADGFESLQQGAYLEFDHPLHLTHGRVMPNTDEIQVTIRHYSGLGGDGYAMTARSFISDLPDVARGEVRSAVQLNSTATIGPIPGVARGEVRATHVRAGVRNLLFLADKTRVKMRENLFKGWSSEVMGLAGVAIEGLSLQTLEGEWRNANPETDAILIEIGQPRDFEAIKRNLEIKIPTHVPIAIFDRWQSGAPFSDALGVFGFPVLYERRSFHEPGASMFLIDKLNPAVIDARARKIRKILEVLDEGRIDFNLAEGSSSNYRYLSALKFLWMDQIVTLRSRPIGREPEALTKVYFEVNDGRSIGELFVRVLPAAEDDILRFQDVTFDLQDQELGIKLSAWIAQNWDDRLRAEVRREKVTPEQVANYFAGRRTAIQLSEVQGDRLLSLPGQRAEVHALSKQQDERALFLQTVVNLLALDHHVRLTVANEDQVRPLRQLFQAYAPGTQPFINFYAENGVQLASALNKVVGGFTVIVTGLEQAKRLDQSVTADAAFVLSDHLISQGVKAYDSGLADLATLALKAHQAGLLDKKTFQLIENATRTYAADSSALQDWAELLSTFQQIAEQLLQAA